MPEDKLENTENVSDPQQAPISIGDPAPSSPTGSPVEEATKVRRAILVVHGMGQQLKFETLDAISNGLFREDRRLNENPAPATGAHAELDGVPLQRVEMRLRRAGKEHCVHLYEAYWSPLTEGVATLRDVFSFLRKAGANGLKSVFGGFRRRAFGSLIQSPRPIRTMIYLLIALLVTFALAAINTALIAVPALRIPLETPPAWLSEGLFADYTTLFNAAFLGLLPFIVCVLISMWLGSRKKPATARIVMGFLSVVLFVVAIFSILATGVLVQVLIGLHASIGPAETIFPVSFAEPLNRAVLIAIGACVPGAVIAYLTMGRKREEPASNDKDRAPAYDYLRTAFVGTVALGLLVALTWVTWKVYFLTDREMSPAVVKVLLRAPVWVALGGAAWLIRGFLVQYLGDVAIYIQSHTLDRFSVVRASIKDTVMKTARAIYAARDEKGLVYDEVVIVGHSLGSVIAYDTLNRLLLDDTVATEDKNLDVAGRTRHLLTFGSPLDKTAFIFAVQSKKSMTQMRDHLANVVQPLVRDPAVRAGLTWRNIYSRWDIISGPLEFYNDRSNSTVPAVINEPDPGALTFLAAHVEYWSKPLLFRRLHEAATGA